jgi:DNA-binding NarL/FixJ family response regulator
MLMNTIRVLLAEDVRVIREMLQTTLNQQPDMHVVASINESNAVLIRAREFEPDVLLLGMLYREEEALQLLRSLRSFAPQTRIVIMDFRPTGGGVAQFIRYGAHGFILPDTPLENMLHVIRLAALKPLESSPEPMPVMPVMPAVAAAAPAALPRPEGSEPLAAFAGAFLFDGVRSAHLTKREEEVAGFICRGWSNKQIAGELHVSLHTVKSHVRRVLEKLELHSRAQVAALGYVRGEITS